MDFLNSNELGGDRCAYSGIYSRCWMLNGSIHVWIVVVFGNFIFFTQFDCGEVLLVIGFMVDAGLHKTEPRTEEKKIIS